MRKKPKSKQFGLKQAAKNDPRPGKAPRKGIVESSAPKGLQLAPNSMYRQCELTKQSALVVVAGRDLSGRPVVREVVMNAARHVVQVLAEKLAGDDPRSLLSRLVSWRPWGRHTP